MYKGLVVIIISFLVLAIIIGQCSSDNDSYTYEDTTIIMSTENKVDLLAELI